MNKAELKIDLINRISGLTDMSVIEQVKRLLDFELSNGVYITTDEQKQAVYSAQMEIENGEFLTEEEAENEIQKWLEK